MQGHSIVRVVGDSYAIEQQQLQIGQRPIRQEALLVLAAWSEQGKAQHASLGV